MDARKEYFIGLDGGTDSVGWAVVEPDYSVVKKNGKSLWGVRLFDSGKTAEERRGYRSARRRTDRKKWRLKLLREIFDAEVTSVDPSFFARLSESLYWEEDKNVDGADTLFHDRDFTDRDYHKKYPTIYHLRWDLMTCNAKPDIRLVYLAVAHIVKNRGHFLNEGQSLESARSFREVWVRLCGAVEDALEIGLPLDIEAEVAQTLLDAELKVTTKTKRLTNLFGEGESDREADCLKALAKLLTGAKTSVGDIFADESLDELGTISFKEKAIEELDTTIADTLGEERFTLLRCAGAIYSWAVFAKLLPEGKTISQVKIEQFDKHRTELRQLKELVRQYAPEKYSKVFRAANVKDNYASYIGSTNCGQGKKQTVRCGKDDFYAFLKKELKNVWDKKDLDPNVAALYQELENGTLLPRQISKENSLIPYQAQKQELDAILQNMQQFYPFLTKEDQNGYTPTYKIGRLLTFRIPYYVGPLNDAHREKGFCWVVKKCDTPILPWNFEQVVDEKASEDQFIRRMTSTCTYLVGEEVLPLNSELYCRFMVLNELNNLRIRGEKISVELKQKIFEELFCAANGGKVTVKKLVTFLKSQNISVTKDDISGIDGDFKASMTPVLKLKNLFASDPLDSETLEELIFTLTVSGDSQKMLRHRVKDILGERADEAILRKVCSLKFAGWGRLSKKFLTEIMQVDTVTGECHCIMDMLWETNNNLMQLLSDAFGFARAVEQYNAERNDSRRKFDYDHLIKDLYVSPAVKRGLWQTLLIVKEIRKIMGKDPSQIFVEMARGALPDQKNNRTVSRKDKLLELYSKCKDDTRDWCKEIEALPEDKLRSDKLYLYYTQRGRCMYSGEPIRLEDLMHEGEDKSRLYDIDHIYPQAKIKDDSLDNRVLVKRTLNGLKTDHYPLPQEMRQQGLWQMLLKNGFISKKKYDRLTRITPFTADELAGFINRQLVETRQSTKAAAQLLGQMFPHSEIVYVKAGLVSDFRHEFDFVKSRDANDFHHAKDAYLNAVVGNVYHEKFTRNPLRFVQSGQEYSLKTETIFRKLDTVKGERIIWKKGEDGSIKTVQARMVKNDPLVTRYAVEVHGALFDLQPMKKGKGQLPLKNGDPVDRYGGYNKLTGSYYTLIAYTMKKKRQKSIECVPLYLAPTFKRDPEALCRYLAEQLKVDHVDILIPEIKIGTLFKWDGFPMTLSGRTGDSLIFRSATELRTTPEQEKYIKRISKYLERCKIRRETLEIIPEFDKLTAEENLKLYDAYIALLQNSLYAKRFKKQCDFLLQKRTAFCQLKIEEQVKLLAEVLHLFQCNPIAADLSLLKGPGRAGIITASKKIDDKVSVSIVNQSVTGFFTREVRLNDL